MVTDLFTQTCFNWCIQTLCLFIPDVLHFGYGTDKSVIFLT